jgi:hypothetical protein
VSTTPTAIFGLSDWPSKLVLIAITVAAAIVLFALLRWLVPKLAGRIRPGTDAGRDRQRQTAAALLSTMLRYLVLVAAIIAVIVILAGGGGIGALGGSAVLAIIIGFASQRLLADVIAGFFILFEGQYGVGDLIALEPSGYVGVVSEVGVRTTVLRDAGGNRCYIPNGQITAVRRFPSLRADLQVTLFTRDPEAAEHALQHLGELAGTSIGIADSAAVSRRDSGDGVAAVHARVAVSAAQAEQARELVSAALRARLGEQLVADPVVTTTDSRDGDGPGPPGYAEP